MARAELGPSVNLGRVTLSVLVGAEYDDGIAQVRFPQRVGQPIDIRFTSGTNYFGRVQIHIPI